MKYRGLCYRGRIVFSSCWTWTHPGYSPPTASCSEFSSTLTSLTKRCDTGIVVSKRLRIVLTNRNIRPCAKGRVVTEVQNRFRQQMHKLYEQVKGGAYIVTVDKLARTIQKSGWTQDLNARSQTI